MSEFSFDGLFDEQEKTDYVVQCTHPVFASYAISTYTSGQFYRFLQRHPNIICHVEESATSGTCSISPGTCSASDPATQSPYTDEVGCTAAGGTWTPTSHEDTNRDNCEDENHPNANSGVWNGESEAIFDVDKTFSRIFEADIDDDIQQPMFSRYDKLTKEYVQVSGAEWIKRYPQAIGEGNRLLDPAGNPNGTIAGGESVEVVKALILLNNQANKGVYRFLANDDDATKTKKLNIQLLLNDIQSSLSGVVTYKQNLGFKLHPECDTFASGVPFQLHLYDENIETRSNKRAVVQRGNPRFAMQPSLAYGVKYAGAIPTDGRPGVLPPPKAGGDNNPQNMVGGELPLSYNPNTKEFEAGNKQILARLLTDVAGVGLNNVNLNNVDTITLDDMKPDGGGYFGNFATGWAMPMSMHNNNPYEYGPTFKNIDCDDNKKNKIRVVNRSSKAFPAGQIVMCTKIDGEWIIMDFGQSNINVKSIAFGRWQFWKTIANKDTYRRDDRYHYDPVLANYHENIVRDHIYEGYFRVNFYQSLEQHLFDVVGEQFGGRFCIDPANRRSSGHSESLAVLNGAYEDKEVPFGAGGANVTITVKKQINFIGSRRYMQATSFDQMHYNHGGNSSANMIGACNPFYNDKGEGVESVTKDNYFHRKLYPHWGPVLKFGYDPASVAGLGASDQGNGQLVGYRAGGSSTPAGFGSNGFLLNHSSFPLSEVKLGNTYGGPSVLEFPRWEDPTKNVFTSTDGLGIHIPADVALNAAPYSTNGAPIEDMQELLKHVNVVSPTVGLQAASKTGANLGYVGGDAYDLMAADYTGKQHDLVAGVRNYLSDAVDLISDTTVTSNSYWHNNAKAQQVLAKRVGQKSWRLGERPNQSRWVYMAKDDSATPTGALPDSLYDLKPNSPNRVVFVPLTAEHFGTADLRAATSPSNNDPKYAHQLALGKQAINIHQSANSLLDGVAGSDTVIWPAAFTERNRNYSWSNQYGFGDLGQDRIVYGGGGSSHGDEVLSIKLNHTDMSLDMFDPDSDLRESTDNFTNGGAGIGLPYGIYTRHTHKYGENGQGFAPNDIWGALFDGVAGIGITSAKCTVNVRGYELAIKSLMSAGVGVQIPRGYQRWGSSSDAQTDFGTTAGYVKVYDAWPEEQTIFDPRYFSVMHFNPGQLLSIPSGKFVGNADQDDSSKMDQYDDMYRWVDNIETTVDHRIPTLSGAPGDIAMKELVEGAIVYNGKSYGNGLQGVLRPSDEWLTCTTRRGMLLPFKYRKKTIRLDYPWKGHNITQNETIKNTQKGRVNNNIFNNSSADVIQEPSVWVAASGNGYKVGHTFVVEGGNAELKPKMVVSSVNNDIDSGPLGAILELIPGDHISAPSEPSFGEGIDPTTFVSEEDYYKILAQDPNQPVSEAPKLVGSPTTNPAGVENTGAGAVVYALIGRCQTITKFDYGPHRQQGAVRFTAASNGKGGAKALAPYARKLGIPKPNKDYAYDVFMQHHNDVSHVFMHSSHSLDNKVQFTDVEIIGV